MSDHHGVTTKGREAYAQGFRKTVDSRPEEGGNGLSIPGLPAHTSGRYDRRVGRSVEILSWPPPGLGVVSVRLLPAAGRTPGSPSPGSFHGGPPPSDPLRSGPWTMVLTSRHFSVGVAVPQRSAAKPALLAAHDSTLGSFSASATPEPPLHSSGHVLPEVAQPGRSPGLGATALFTEFLPARADSRSELSQGRSGGDPAGGRSLRSPSPLPGSEAEESRLLLRSRCWAAW